MCKADSRDCRKVKQYEKDPSHRRDPVPAMRGIFIFYSSLPYASSETASHHSVEASSPAISIAR